MSVGSGFNILNDEIKPAALFKMSPEKAKQAFYGIQLPKGFEMTKVNQSETFMEHFESKDEFVAKRLSQLNINLDCDLKLFSIKCRGGFSLSDSKSRELSSIESSFLYEKRIFRVD